MLEPESCFCHTSLVKHENQTDTDMLIPSIIHHYVSKQIFELRNKFNANLRTLKNV